MKINISKKYNFYILYFLSLGFFPLIQFYFELFDDDNFNIINEAIGYVSIGILISSLNIRNIIFVNNNTIRENIYLVLKIYFFRLAICLIYVLIVPYFKDNLIFVLLLISFLSFDTLNIIILKYQLFKIGVFYEAIRYLSLLVFIFTSFSFKNSIIFISTVILINSLILIYIFNKKWPFKKTNIKINNGSYYKYFLPVLDFLSINSPRFFSNSVDYEINIRIIFYLLLVAIPFQLYFQKVIVVNRNFNLNKNQLFFLLMVSISSLILSLVFHNITLKIFLGVIIYLSLCVFNYLNLFNKNFKFLFIGGLISSLSIVFYYYIPNINIIYFTLILRIAYQYYKSKTYINENLTDRTYR